MFLQWLSHGRALATQEEDEEEEEEEGHSKHILVIQTLVTVLVAPLVRYIVPSSTPCLPRHCPARALRRRWQARRVDDVRVAYWLTPVAPYAHVRRPWCCSSCY